MDEYYVEERMNAFMFSMQDSKLDMQSKLHMRYKGHAFSAPTVNVHQRQLSCFDAQII